MTFLCFPLPFRKKGKEDKCSTLPPQFYFLYLSLPFTWEWNWTVKPSETCMNVNKCVSFKFLFSFPTPRKKWLQLYKCTRRIRKREKCMWRYKSIDSTCTNDLKSPKEGSLWNLGVLNGIPQPPLPFEVRKIITPHCWKEEGARIYSFGFKMYVL